MLSTVAEGPQNLAIVVLTGTCITIKFDAVATSELYYIMFQNYPGLDFTLTGNDIINNTLSKDVDNVIAETTYTVNVIANVGALNSTKSVSTATTG